MLKLIVIFVHTFFFRGVGCFKGGGISKLLSISGVRRMAYSDSDISMQCNSAMSVKWRKNRKHLAKKHSIVQNTLLIENLVTEDSGTYTCYGMLQDNAPFQYHIHLHVGGE